MFGINYDLARQITEERRAEAMAAAARRRVHTRPIVAQRAERAEVIELTFSSHCEAEQVGA